jgi:SAM-dependent MidA family methyltransferase
VSSPTLLEDEIRQLIAVDGPLSVARYMELCLAHPTHGYYVTRDPFGVHGDFTTAPEISQMFGELLGLWAAAAWRAMGAPSLVVLAELGPGRGTLMLDALRAATLVPEFRAALSVAFVETSPVLRAQQEAAFAEVDAKVTWHADLTDVAEGPLIVIANEFLDALPVHQAVKTQAGWHDRMVGLDAEGRLTFALNPDPIPSFETILPQRLRNAQPGAIFEWRSDRIVNEICHRLVSFGGVALAIDYGHIEMGLGDTLQAVRAHAYVDPLERPGDSDLTAHVDFAALVGAAHHAGVRTFGPLTQRDFLVRLGIEARAGRLKASATPSQLGDIDAALARLIGAGRNEMGALFKVLALAHPRLQTLPAFDS